MRLSDRTILSRLTERHKWEPWQLLECEPWTPDMIQPCSIDLHLGRTLKVWTGAQMDTRRDNSPWWRELPAAGQTHDDPERVWVLQPDRFYLGVLAEFIRVPEDICAQLGGVSTRARDGVMIHQLAGLLDPGWYGWATLEISVQTTHTILVPGQRIGQVTFELLDGRCANPYRGRYQGDKHPQPARLKLESAA
jgi:dCTP deaminase